jgi:adenylate cyclase class IV
MQEIEIRFVQVDPEQIVARLKTLEARLKGDKFLEEWIFKADEWLAQKKLVRVRQVDHALPYTVSYKHFTRDTGDGNTEIEFALPELAEFEAFLKEMGVTRRRHQQKRRVSYHLDECSVDLDFWPLIDPVLEIEGPSRSAVEALATKLGLNLADKIEFDQFFIYKNLYGIDLDEMTEVVFEEKEIGKV